MVNLWLQFHIGKNNERKTKIDDLRQFYISKPADFVNRIQVAVMPEISALLTLDA
jgi:hypothetical protein